MAASTGRPTAGDGRSRAGRREILQPGQRAPDFTLPTTPDQTIGLADFRGRPVILLFYPADWSPVCGDEVALFNEVLPEFQRHHAELLGISVDGVWCHIAYARHLRLHFPLLSDFEPKGEVAREYGAYRSSEGVSERALFLVRGDGVIHWSYLSPIGVNPGADGVLAALEDLSRSRTRKEPAHGHTHTGSGSHRTPAAAHTARR